MAVESCDISQEQRQTKRLLFKIWRLKFTVIKKKPFGTWQFGKIGVLVYFIIQKLEKQTLSLSQFLRYITWFKSQDLPFNGENVGLRWLGEKQSWGTLVHLGYWIKVLSGHTNHCLSNSEFYTLSKWICKCFPVKKYLFCIWDIACFLRSLSLIKGAWIYKTWPQLE